VLLKLLGGVALLLWGMRMVETGISHAFGSGLRKLVGGSMRHPVMALFVGLGVTGLLQSSTATAMITASFARQGLVQTAPALAVMLGADVGTSLVVQVLYYDLSWLSPLLFLIGVVGYKTGRSTVRQNVSRAIIGLGMILLALSQIVSVTEPLRGASPFHDLLRLLSIEPIVLLLMVAVLTWLAHSSMAMVLLCASLTSGGLLSLEAGLAMVLGANLGGGLPQITATLGSAPEVRRIPFGNFLFKITGVAVTLPLLTPLTEYVASMGDVPGRQIVHFHMFFNLGLATVFLFLTRPVANLLQYWLPDAEAREDSTEPRYLDLSAIENPALALAHAERETLRMGDVVERMLDHTITVLRTNDRTLLEKIERMDDTVDALYQAIKFYLTDLSREPLNEKESLRTTEIISFTINLEHIGDIIDKNLMELAATKIRNHLQFSEEGLRELSDLHHHLLENLKLGFGVFMSGDVDMARRLLREKATFRRLERSAAENHLNRLRVKRIESIDTSSLHMDILNELKRINSHITSVAYPILEQAGALFSSRLKPDA